MKKYRIKNWSQYNKSLIQRGSINLWISDDVISKWKSDKHTCKKGRPEVYSDEAILCALIVRTVYHLPLRALQGFLFSMIVLLLPDLPIPSYSQICRRAKNLGRDIEKLSQKRPKDIVFDSTGLKVYGEGEWKVRQHGVSKRRTWRKLHIGLDPQSNEIILGELTSNGTGSGDGTVGKRLIEKLPKGVKRIIGDGGYDGLEFRQEGDKKGAEVIVPPPKDAVVQLGTKDPAVENRNNALFEIQGLGGGDDGRKCWKILKCYHIRSLVETAMYRIKQLTGEKLRSRSFERQCVEADIKCLIVNKMTRLGMPIGQWV